MESCPGHNPKPPETHFRHRPETNLPKHTTQKQFPHIFPTYLSRTNDLNTTSEHTTRTNTSEGTAPQHRGPPDAASDPSDTPGPGTVGEARPPHHRETGAGARASAPTTGRGGGGASASEPSDAPGPEPSEKPAHLISARLARAPGPPPPPLAVGGGGASASELTD